MKVNKIVKYIKNPRLIIPYLMFKRIFSKLIPDEVYLKHKYKWRMGKKLDLSNPQTFNEKLQWLKLHDRKDIYTTMVDKCEVKKYVANIIGDEYIIPTLGIYERFDDIDFDKLPNQFVIKCTHDSGGLVIVKDKYKLNIKKAKKKINKSLKRNYYWGSREWPYKNVKPRIIIEKYMKDKLNTDLIDYKFFCFNSEPVYCQVISNRSTNETIDFFDMNWNHQKFTGFELPNEPAINSLKPINVPTQFENMKKIARKLSQVTFFLRVDFYEIEGKVYFGELTFYPFAGMGVLHPDKYNFILGEMLKLPEKRE